MHTPPETVDGDVFSSTPCPVWGVMVARNAPSKENGLLRYARTRYANLHAAVVGQKREPREDALPAPGEAWLWRHLSQEQRRKHFPLLAPAHVRSAPPHGLEAEEEERKAYEQLRVLIPLCSTGHGTVTIGRLASNDMALTTNPCVSSVHCSISFQPRSTRDTDKGVEDAESQRAAHDTAVAVERAVAHHHGYSLAAAHAQAAAADGDREEQASAQEKMRNGASANPTRSSADTAHIVLSDYSTNGCAVNGRQVGKGTSAQLRNGDVVELINAGPRHTADYNLSFLFLTGDGFKEWASQQKQSEEEERSAETPASPSRRASADASAHRRQQQQQQQRHTVARRHALLCKAQWNVEAQVRRMYGHRVDEYYALDRVKPLGEGTFGVVFRAALRTDGANGASALQSIAKRILSEAGLDGVTRHGWDQQLFGTAAACVWAANPALEGELAEAYVREKEQRPPATVPRAMASAKPGLREDDTTTPSHLFAIKVIRKQRMLLDVLQQQQQQQGEDTESKSTSRAASAREDTPAPTTAIAALSSTEAAVLQQLMLLETQPDDLADQRREEWTANALASLQLADITTMGGSVSGSLDPIPPTFSLNAQDAEAEGKAQAVPVSTRASADSVVTRPLLPQQQQQQQQRQAREQRERRRHELLRYLPETLRRSYEKELQHRRRQQCEINILLAVRHPNVTTLYEVFDQPDQLALVMEQATGGEVWDLLQPYQQRKRRCQTSKKPRVEDSTTCNAQRASVKPDDVAGEAVYDDVDLLGVGGPLPEYLVKLIIVQVLEAVLYLHTMGIIHRDLKLENMMLQRPCDRYALNALQLQMLLHELRDYEHAGRKGERRAASVAAPPGKMIEEFEFSNPLSVLHTVHIPRALWPVVKVTDFGLSRVLDQLQTRPASTAAAETLHGFEAASRGSEMDRSKGVLPERVRLIYARNDATTSCGTPIYAAPEVIHASLRPNKVGYSAAVDIYSVGVIAYALLTGRAPFPSRRHPRRPDGPPVVDYDAPLRFQRHRRRSSKEPNDIAAAAAAAVPPLRTSRMSCVDEVAAMLPALAIVESVRVPIASPSPATTAAASTSAHALQWRVHAEALAARVRRAECERVDAGAGSSDRSGASLFTTTVQQLRRSLSSYADGCAFHHEVVDLDRLVYVSTEAAATAANAQGTSSAASPVPAGGRVMGADGLVHDVALPPISALGASFLRGLLEKYPSQRLTAYEALQHPWLRECVTPEAYNAASKK